MNKTLFGMLVGYSVVLYAFAYNLITFMPESLTRLATVFAVTFVYIVFLLSFIDYQYEGKK